MGKVESLTKNSGAFIVRIWPRHAASKAIRDPFSAEEGGRGYPPYVQKNKGPAKAEPMSKHKPYPYLI